MSQGEDRDPLSVTAPYDLASDELAQRLQRALGAEYAVESRLGAGGFASVFLVRDVRLKRALAVKVLSPELVSSPTVRDRFQREAETVAQLSHPNIVPLFFVGQQDDLLYLVMEAVGGGSLADKLEREGRLGVEDAARLFAEVAGALAHAHKRGVIHRDIKPQNILLDAESGRALVTDFGIARTVDGGSLTATGMVIGTPQYLSPEQVIGEPSDHRADIYALGVMIYEVLSGAAAFQASSPTAAMMKRLAGPPVPIREVRPDVPEAFESVLMACLATDPAERVATAGEIVRALHGQISLPGIPLSGGHTAVGRTESAVVATGEQRRGVDGVASGEQTRTIPRARQTGALRLVMVAAVLATALGVWWFTTQSAKAGSSPVDSLAASLPPVDTGMVLIAAGTYPIGTNDGPADTRPQRTVSLPAFGMSQHEVTVGEYQRFVDAGRAPATWPAGTDLRLPVTGVVLAEAAGYCAWRHPDGGRLPSETEWEAAARGTIGRTYAWGNTWSASAANVDAAARRPEPVGSHPAGRTPEGLDDMIGNVWEWTSSPYTATGIDAVASADQYVIRGGAFNAYRQVATTTFRGRARSAAQRSDLASTGFRCVMPTRQNRAPATPTG